MKNKIVIDGKEFALPDSLANEIKEKLSPKEPTTFEECVVVHKEAWVTNCQGPTWVDGGYINRSLLHGEAVPSEKRALQLAAIAKMMTVADALNNGWTKVDGNEGYFIYVQGNEIRTTFNTRHQPAFIWFRNGDLAIQAVRILGESTIKTAFGL